MSNKILVAYAVIVTVIAGGMAYGNTILVDIANEYQNATTTDPYTTYLETIEERPEFKEWVDLHKREIYWTEQRDRATMELEAINVELLENEQVRAEKVEAYLQKRNPALVQYATEISKLPRYMDVLAIAYQETKLCTVGVGEPGRNNCGGIKSHREDRTFKEYANAMDALEDISYLLHEPHLVGKSIEEMNGIYCVDEEVGGACDAWTENIKSEVNVILNS